MTECYKLFANRTSSSGVTLTLTGMWDHPLHFVASGWLAIGIPAFACMHQTVDASLNSNNPVGIAVLVCASGLTHAPEVKTKFFHAITKNIHVNRFWHFMCHAFFASDMSLKINLNIKICNYSRIFLQQNEFCNHPQLIAAGIAGVSTRKCFSKLNNNEYTKNGPVFSIILNYS